MDGWTDGRTDGRIDGWMDGRVDRWMGGRMIVTIVLFCFSHCFKLCGSPFLVPDDHKNK